MRKLILNFEQYNKLFEGGAAIKTSRRIREDEYKKTLESIQEFLLPLLDIEKDSAGESYMVIGSIGKKKLPDDTSGDLDIGYDGKKFAESHNIEYKENSVYIYEILKNKLSKLLGFDVELNYLRGLNIVSIGWPINGDGNIGIVQLDLIPLSNMKWAEFIYYSPDYRIDESRYKSAHRNWLLAAILAARMEILENDENGEILDYKTPVLILSDGLFIHTKSYRGKLKSRLKNPKKIEGSEEFITNDPQEFIDFALGKGYKESQIKSFEKLWDIVNEPNFELYDRIDIIKNKLIDFLNRVKLEIPKEIEY